MATEKERTRVYFNEFGVIEVATGKKVKIEVNDSQNAGDDVTITMPATSGTLMLDSEATMTTLVQSGTTAFTGPGSLAVGYEVHENGNLRTLTLGRGFVINASAGVFSQAALIDAGNRPTTDTWMPIIVLDNGLRRPGFLNIQTNGTVLIHNFDVALGTTVSFPMGATVGIEGSGVTWNVTL